MITYITETSILDSHADAIVIPVNCVGVMGAGLAKAYKDRYPYDYAEYTVLCHGKYLALGKVAGIYSLHKRRVVYFPTKNHWRENSSIAGIKIGLVSMVQWIHDHTDVVQSIAFPQLGCGKGNLQWKQVKPLMEEYLLPLDLTIYIHEYE